MDWLKSNWRSVANLLAIVVLYVLAQFPQFQPLKDNLTEVLLGLGILGTAGLPQLKKPEA